MVAVVAVLVVTSMGGTSTTPPAAKPSTTPKAVHPTPTPPPGKWEYIGTRATDSAPLTLHELFPGSFVADGVYWHVTIKHGTPNCHIALIGAALQAAVRKADCTQALRASYTSRLEKAMATIGVFNLTSAAAASSAATHTGPSQFVAALAAKNGVTSKIGQGTGVEEAIVKGHYLVLVWAENVDLQAPKTNWQRHHLTNFMNLLLEETINGGLSYRMVEGKPESGKPSPPPSN